ncbi:hypothetical protein AAGG74_16630 [Bacillus mexicanus]|uniref:hypothetical protein n=1 Tax=Bacillus mexicanus TaxID=2834415 RepID=UPI003D218F48
MGIIEEGMTFLKRQKSVSGGSIDILAKESKGGACVKKRREALDLVLKQRY